MVVLTRIHRHAEWVSGGGWRDGNLQPHSGGNGSRQSVHDQRNAESSSRVEQLQYHVEHGELYDHAEACLSDPRTQRVRRMVTRILRLQAR